MRLCGDVYFVHFSHHPLIPSSHHLLISSSVDGAVDVEDEAEAACRFDLWCARELAEFVTNSGDVRVYNVRLRIELDLPDLFEQLGSRDDLLWTHEEIFEQVVFLRRQLERLV